MNEGKGLVPGYPQSMLDILGKCNIAAVHGSTHKYMRGALLALVSPPMIKDQLLPKIDHFIRSHLTNWDDQVIDIQQKTKEVCFPKYHYGTDRMMCGGDIFKILGYDNKSFVLIHNPKDHYGYFHDGQNDLTMTFL